MTGGAQSLQDQRKHSTFSLSWINKSVLTLMSGKRPSCLSLTQAFDGLHQKLGAGSFSFCGLCIDPEC